LKNPDKLENAEAKRDGATLQPNSGRGKFAKGDAILAGEFMVDYKHFTKSFNVSSDNLAKLNTDARTAGGYEGIFKLVLDNSTVRYWVVPEYVIPDYIKYRDIAARLSEKYPDIYDEVSNDE